jgi:hypothetical protein
MALEERIPAWVKPTHWIFQTGFSGFTGVSWDGSDSCGVAGNLLQLEAIHLLSVCSGKSC